MLSACYYCQVLIKCEFSGPIFGKKNTQISNFMKIRPVEVELFHADVQTGVTKLIVAFCNFPTAHKNTKYHSIQRIVRHAPVFKSARELARNATYSENSAYTLALLRFGPLAHLSTPLQNTDTVYTCSFPAAPIDRYVVLYPLDIIRPF
jgi:hypothetical protein